MFLAACVRKPLSMRLPEVVATLGNGLSETRRSEAGGSCTTRYAYDATDRVSTVISPTGKVLTAQRDAAGGSSNSAPQWAPVRSSSLWPT
jgi:YD repeat-containing protein